MIEAASSKSMPELAYTAVRPNSGEVKQESKQESAYMPSAGEKKAKKGFLSFLKKDSNKFKVVS